MAITVTSTQVRPLKGAHVRRRVLAVACIAGALAYIQNDARAGKADRGAALTAHARGIVLADGYGSIAFTPGQTVDVVVFGPVSGFVGLTPGLPVYVDVDGAVTQTKPVAGFVSQIGYAEDETTVFVQPNPATPVAA